MHCVSEMTLSPLSIQIKSVSSARVPFLKALPLAFATAAWCSGEPRRWNLGRMGSGGGQQVPIIAVEAGDGYIQMQENA